MLESHYCKSQACMSKYFNAHIHSSDADVQVKARAEYLKAQLLTQLMWSSSTAKQYLRYNDTCHFAKEVRERDTCTFQTISLSASLTYSNRELISLTAK